MSARKIRGSWWVDLSWKGQRVRRRSPLNSRTGAQTYETTLRQELGLTGSVDALMVKEQRERETLRASRMTFKAFAERWLVEYAAVNNKPSEVSTKTYTVRTTLVPAIGDLELGEVTTMRIEHLKQSLLAKGQSPKTINNKIGILRKCLNTAIDWGYLRELPRIKQLKVPPQAFRYLSSAEANRLIEAATGQWRAMIVVALRTGLRYSELSALRWSDIDLTSGLITIQRGQVRGRVGAPKNNRIRHGWLTSDAVDALLSLTGNREGWVFHHEGELITHRSAERALHRVLDAAKMQGVGWHTFRHSFASHLASNGIPLHMIRDLMGHSTIQMTLRYAHLAAHELRAAVETLDPQRQPAGNRQATNTKAPLVTALLN